MFPCAAAISSEPEPSVVYPATPDTFRPITLAPLPSTAETAAPLPITTLLVPVVRASPAAFPTQVFSEPVVSFHKASLPTAVL